MQIHYLYIHCTVAAHEMREVMGVRNRCIDEGAWWWCEEKGDETDVEIWKSGSWQKPTSSKKLSRIETLKWKIKTKSNAKWDILGVVGFVPMWRIQICSQTAIFASTFCRKKRWLTFFWTCKTLAQTRFGVFGRSKITAKFAFWPQIRVAQLERSPETPNVLGFGAHLGLQIDIFLVHCTFWFSTILFPNLSIQLPISSAHSCVATPFHKKSAPHVESISIQKVQKKIKVFISFTDQEIQIVRTFHFLNRPETPVIPPSKPLLCVHGRCWSEVYHI